MPEESKKLTVAQLIKLCRYADKGKQLKTSSGMLRRVKWNQRRFGDQCLDLQIQVISDQATRRNIPVVVKCYQGRPKNLESPGPSDSVSPESLSHEMPQHSRNPKFHRNRTLDSGASLYPAPSATLSHPVTKGPFTYHPGSTNRTL